MSTWRSLAASTGKPAAWSLVLHLALGAAAGGAIGLLVEPVRGAVLSAVSGAVVAAIGTAGSLAVVRRAALVVAVVVVVCGTLAFATTGLPLAAALAVGSVAVLTSVAAGAGQVGALLGVIASLAYAFVAGLALLAELTDVLSVPTAVVRLVIGAAAGYAVAVTSAAWRTRRTEAAPREPSVRSGLGDVRGSLVDGLRRAVPLAITMALFQSWGTRDSLWIFFAALVVVLPADRAPWRQSVTAVASAAIAVVVLTVLGGLIDPLPLAALGVALSLLGIAWKPPYPLVGTFLVTVGAILVAGAPGTTGEWAVHRLRDTLVGGSLALVCLYLPLPGVRRHVGSPA